MSSGGIRHQGQRKMKDNTPSNRKSWFFSTFT
jgi:hypothetical protein